VRIEKEDSGKLWVRVDFRDINRATPKDEYPMTRADMLINDVSGHRVISFLDCNASYNQIFMAEVDASQMAFIFLGFIGLFEYFIMTFGLKNKGVYPVQRAPALCRVWGRVLVASLTLACAMRGDRNSNPGPFGPQAVRLYRLHQAWCKLSMGYEFP